jgi:hypothetical protein
MAIEVVLTIGFAAYSFVNRVPTGMLSFYATINEIISEQ